VFELRRIFITSGIETSRPGPSTALEAPEIKTQQKSEATEKNRTPEIALAP
jgi:hypothetical protein